MPSFLVTHETTGRVMRMVHAKDADAAAKTAIDAGEIIDSGVISSRVLEVKPARQKPATVFLIDDGAMGDESVTCEEPYTPVRAKRPSAVPPPVEPPTLPAIGADGWRRLAAGEEVRPGDEMRLNSREQWRPVTGLVGHIVKATDRAEFRTKRS